MVELGIPPLSIATVLGGRVWGGREGYDVLCPASYNLAVEVGARSEMLG